MSTKEDIGDWTDVTAEDQKSLLAEKDSKSGKDSKAPTSIPVAIKLEPATAHPSTAAVNQSLVAAVNPPLPYHPYNDRQFILNAIQLYKSFTVASYEYARQLIKSQFDAAKTKVNQPLNSPKISLTEFAQRLSVIYQIDTSNSSDSKSKWINFAVGDKVFAIWSPRTEPAYYPATILACNKEDDSVDVIFDDMCIGYHVPEMLVSKTRERLPIRTASGPITSPEHAIKVYKNISHSETNVDNSDGVVMNWINLLLKSTHVICLVQYKESSIGNTNVFHSKEQINKNLYRIPEGKLCKVLSVKEESNAQTTCVMYDDMTVSQIDSKLLYYVIYTHKESEKTDHLKLLTDLEKLKSQIYELKSQLVKIRNCLPEWIICRPLDEPIKLWHRETKHNIIFRQLILNNSEPTMTGLFSGFYEGGAHAGHFENVNLLSFADNKNEEYTLFPSVTLFGISDEFEEPWLKMNLFAFKKSTFVTCEPKPSKVGIRGTWETENKK